MDSPQTATTAGVGRSEATGAAHRLSEARRTGVPCSPVRDLIGQTDTALAYLVQDAWVAERRAAGARVTGRKVGLTAPAVQRQLGVDQPDFGVLFDDMDVSGRSVAPELLLQPKIEAEIAFGLQRDLDAPDLDESVVRAAVSWVAPALEIVDSRIVGWDIRITDTIADNASSGLYVLGERREPHEVGEPREILMTMDLDGDRVSSGDGSACLGDPFTALLWCARTARDRGTPLRAGELVLSGALGPMVPVGPGAHVTAELTTLGSVQVRFEQESDPR